MVLLLEDLDSLLEVKLQAFTGLRLQLVHSRGQPRVVFLIQLLSLPCLAVTITRTNLVTKLGERAFSYVGPVIWNNLPEYIHAEPDTMRLRHTFLDSHLTY